MKTILIAHNYSEKSFASMSFHLAHHLANKGNRVVFISHHPFFASEQIIDNLKGEIIICSWPTKKRPTTLKDIIWFSKLYFKYKPDIVVGHFVGSNISVTVSKILSFGKVKTFEYYHTLSTQILEDINGNGLKQKILFLRKKAFYMFFCDLIICPSEIAKTDLKSFFSISKSLVILNPMMDRFKNKAILSKDSINISYLGRLDSSKGVTELINAFEIYKKKFEKSRILLNIAGAGSQGKIIRELSIKNSAIEYCSGLSYDKIDAYLNESHYAIIPSKFDNLPTVGLEAMMNQTPLLISNATGLAQYLTDGKECYKFEPTIEAIITVFEKVERNFDNNIKMGNEARATFLNTFSMSRYCDSFSEILLK